MARINTEEVVRHLNHEFRGALVNTLEAHLPGSEIDDEQVLRTFLHHLRRRSAGWDYVPGGCGRE